MSLVTKSSFYYCGSVNSTNKWIDFSEGGPQLSAQVPIGSYSLTETVSQIARAMNSVGVNTYSVTFNRSTRIVTITSSASFDLLGSTGSNSTESILSFIGIPQNDFIGATSIVGTSAFGSRYEPQFTLQDHIDPSNNKKALTATVSKSASGRKVSVQSFGEERFMECNIKYITNIGQGESGKLSSDPNGIENARLFLDHCITKSPVEFMKDKLNVNSFQTFILDSTPEEQDGTAYRLKELYGQNLPNYFDTGVLKFKLIEG